MIVDNIEIVTVLVILLFLIPVLINANKKGLLKNFTFINLIKTFNKSLIIQGIIALCLFPLVWIFQGLNLDFLENVMIGTGYTYIILAIFMYLPILLLLNLIGLFIRKTK